MAEKTETTDPNFIPSSEGYETEYASLQLGSSASDADLYTRRLNAAINRDRSRTENMIATLLVWAVVLSLPVMVLVTRWLPESSKDFQSLFDRWITLVGPLAGAAVGFGARDRSDRRNGDV